METAEIGERRPGRVHVAENWRASPASPGETPAHAEGDENKNEFAVSEGDRSSFPGGASPLGRPRRGWFVWRRRPFPREKAGGAQLAPARQRAAGNPSLHRHRRGSCVDGGDGGCGERDREV